MLQSIRSLKSKITLFRIRQNALFMVAMAREIRDLRTQRSGEKRLEPFGFKVYSQGDEDGIIAEIFRRVGISNKRFVEFGCGDGRENNTAFLLMQGWSGLWMDVLEENELALRRQWPNELASGQLSFIRARITADTINTLLQKGGVTGEIDFLSLDIDSNDYHVWKAINAISPRVVCIEYNAKFPPPVEWIMPREDDYVWNNTDKMGASLSAMEKLGAAKNYNLVGCDIIGSNAFFVRSDLAKGKFEEPFSAANHYHPPRYYLSYGFFSGHPMFGPTVEQR